MNDFIPAHLRTIRLELFEVYEEASEFPLFVTSDISEVDKHLHEYPEDRMARCYWVREGER